MISFRSFSLVISVVLLRQVALQNADHLTSTAATESGQSLHWLIGGCVLFCVIGKFLPVLAMFRADTAPRQLAWQEMERRRQWLEWSWLVVQGWLLANTGAAPILARAEQQGIPSALMMWLWFAPTLIFLSALEFGFTQLECLWSRDGDTSSSAHRRRWLQRVRLGNLGQIITCLTPVVVLLALLDGVRYLVPELPVLWQAAVALLGLLITGVLFAPLWLRWWSGAAPMPTEHAVVQRVQTLCLRTQVRAPQVLSLGDGQTWQGVALVGWTPLFRQIWIGPSVCSALSAEQLDMVLLHELAHLKRGHCWWRIIPVLTAGMGVIALMTAWPFDTGLEWAQVTVALAFAGLMMWMLGYVSKQCELDADRQACQMAIAHCTWSAGQPTRAMNALRSALEALHDANNSPNRSHWLHPSLARRLTAKP